MLTSSLWDQSALNAAGRPWANSCSAASSFAMNVAHSESASRPNVEPVCIRDPFTVETTLRNPDITPDSFHWTHRISLDRHSVCLSYCLKEQILTDQI